MVIASKVDFPQNLVLYHHIITIDNALFSAPDGSVKELFFPKALDLSRPKRPRTTFSSEQLDRMEKEFLQNPYLVGKERRKLAADLGLSETQVCIYA